jgi:diguanylate cyclase (GGDEF)-like protein
LLEPETLNHLGFLADASEVTEKEKFPSDIDLRRMIDMDRRLRPIRLKAMAVLAVAFVLAAPWIGWWTLGPLLLAAVTVPIAHRLIDRSARPDRALFIAWALQQMIIAASVATTGRPEGSMLLAMPIVTLAARFPPKQVRIGLGLTAALFLGIVVGVDLETVVNDPPLVIVPGALIVATAVLSTTFMHSDIEQRSAAIIDPLTGLLNRNALLTRVREITEQSHITKLPIGIVLGDIDHFKTINDTHGHSRGDAVLKDVAYLLRKELRTLDLLYRIGGEEFLVLLPGATLEDATIIAERLRLAVESSMVGEGDRVTMSLGVGASMEGTPFDYEVVFARADQALYAAKHSGRNAVRTVPAPGEAPRRRGFEVA